MLYLIGTALLALHPFRNPQQLGDRIFFSGKKRETSVDVLSEVDGSMVSIWLGGGFKYFVFSPLLGEMIQFEKYFSSGLKPPTRWVTTYL